MSTGLAETVAMLRAAYPRQDFPDPSIGAYVAALADLPVEDVHAAVLRLIKRTEWLPSIAEIRREVAEARVLLPGPAEAWEQVQTVEGRRAALPAVRRAVEAVGGPWALRTSDSPTVLRSQFFKVYGELREDAVRVVSEGRLELAGVTTLQIERGPS